MKNRTIYVLLGIFVIIVAVSGCTDSNSTKQFDNGKVSFDYPADMTVKEENNSMTESILITKGTTAGVSIHTNQLIAETFDEFVNKDEGIKKQLTKFTLNGKNAYNITYENMDGSTTKYTRVDDGDKVYTISPYIVPANTNLEDTESYKAYQIVVNNFKIQ